MSDVRTIDTHYFDQPRGTAAYLVKEGDRAAFVETATAKSRPRFLAALEEEGLSPEQVDYVIITHVHLDHAGGAAALMEVCPNATLLAHPRAAKHAIDPSKLVKSAQQVYGAERFAELYGTIDPVDASRVRVMEDGETLQFGTRTWTFLHTRGHANHHFCIQDSALAGVFTGDSFGLVYPDLQGGGLFAIPSTSPTDFDAPAARESLERIVDTGAERVFLTHFGEREDVEAIAAMLDAQLARYGAIADEAFETVADEELDAFCATGVKAIFDELLAERGLDAEEGLRGMLALDESLNAQGVAFSVRKRRFKASQTK